MMKDKKLLPFTKMHGIGNDFILLDAIANPWAVELPWTDLAARACDRHFGIGADGVILAARGSRLPFRMIMFNPDGTEDMCGNGIRCFAALLCRRGYARETRFEAETIAGTKTLVVESVGKEFLVSVDMGKPSFAARDLPAAFDGESILQYPLRTEAGEREISCVSTGTTHTVIFVDRLPEDSTFVAASREIETHDLFPRGTSVLWVVVETRTLAKIRIWERGGVGESLACGTGACAVVAVGRKLDLLDSPCTVRSKGGELKIAWDGENGIQMTGPAAVVYEGVWPLPEFC